MDNHQHVRKSMACHVHPDKQHELVIEDPLISADIVVCHKDGRWCDAATTH